MRVGIDAHCIGQGKTGNETYTYNLVKHLSLLSHEDTSYFVYLTSKARQDNGIRFGSQFCAKLLRLGSPYFRIPIGFAIASRLQRLDVLHAQYLLPQQLKCRTVLTVHDVLFERFPEFFTKADYYRNTIGIPWSCRRADHIITVSECSKRDLIFYYGLNPDRITVTYLAADECYRPIEAGQAREHLKKYGIGGEFILYIGTIQPRKNISRLLSAFAQAKKRGLPHKLVIVGPKAWLSGEAFRALAANPYEEDIVVTGYVPRSDLVYFYNAAAAFVYVSIAEGFGLPVLEAMACGTPTITSFGSSLEEVAAGAAFLVDPLDDTAIASAIVDIVSDADYQTKLRDLGLARSKQFSYQKMADQTRSIYLQLSN